MTQPLSPPPDRQILPSPLLTGLRDEEAHVVAEDGRLAVEEVGSEVDHDGQLGQLLQQLPRGDGRVEAGAAGDQDQAAAPLDLRQVVLHEGEIGKEVRVSASIVCVAGYFYGHDISLLTADATKNLYLSLAGTGGGG